MNHQDFSVVLLDDHGQRIGSKLRRDIDKVHDVVHCVDVLVFDGDKLLINSIPGTTGQIYVNGLAPAPATMLRVDETTEEAAHRALKKELGIDGGELHLLGEHFYVYPDGIKRLKTVYWMQHSGAFTANPEDVANVRWMSREDVTTAMSTEPNSIAPVFTGVWDEYQSVLPF